MTNPINALDALHQTASEIFRAKWCFRWAKFLSKQGFSPKEALLVAQQKSQLQSESWFQLVNILFAKWLQTHSPN